MATSGDDAKFSLMELLEAMLNCRIEPGESQNHASYALDDDLVSRGSHSEKSRSHNNVKWELERKVKRNKMIQNLNALKDFIQGRNEERSLKKMAEILGEVTTEEQKTLFINELKQKKSSTPGHSSQTDSGFDRQSCSTSGSYPEGLMSRSSVPQASNDMLDSIHLNSLSDEAAYSYVLRSNPIRPISMERYNDAERYVIQKGISYCRILLHNWFRQKDTSIINELKSRNILSFVLLEYDDSQKNYLTNLVDHFPRSCEEILFILKEDKEVILRSPIFVLLAQKSLMDLKEFIAVLIDCEFNSHELSQYCHESKLDGISVLSILSTSRVNDVPLKAGILKFLNLYKTNDKVKQPT